jgi:hypothetical protein
LSKTEPIRRIAGIAGLALALACSGGEAPGRIPIERVVEVMVASVGRHDPDAIMRHVALGFRGGMRDREPNLDYGAAQSIVLEFLMRDSPLSARLDLLRVDEPREDRGTRARARVWFAASNRLDDPDFPVPPSAVAYEFELTFERRDGTWRVAHLEYQRASGG